MSREPVAGSDPTIIREPATRVRARASARVRARDRARARVRVRARAAERPYSDARTDLYSLGRG